MSSFEHISQLLSANRIRLRSSAATGAEAIDELMALAATHPAVRDAPATRQAVIDREQRMSTAVGHGIALPHAKTPAVTESVGAFLTTVQPLDFNALDGQPVSIFFLLVGPPGATTQHIRVLGRVSRLLNQSDFREAVLAARDVEDLLHLLDGAEAELLT